MLPKKITIMGQQVKIVSKIPKKILQQEMFVGFNPEDVLGSFSGQDSIIYINPKQNDEQKLRTLLHEITHAIVYRSGIKFTISWSGDLEEVLCEAVSNTLYETLSKDPSFVECFLS